MRLLLLRLLLLLVQLGPCIAWQRVARPPRACASEPQTPLDELALAQKLSSLGGKKKRGRGRPARSAPRAPRTSAPAERKDAAPSASSGASDLVGDESDDVRVWEVPEQLRMPGAEPVEAHGRHVSLEELFPGSGLAEAWDTNGALRTALRRALRDDLFAPALPSTWSEKQRAMATDLGSACMTSWRMVDAQDMACERFSAAFAEHGVELDGRDFVLGLGALCGERPHGSLIEICPLERKVVHSWHQDSGISSMTVILGFPPRDRVEASAPIGGVFSHQIKLSHRLRPNSGDEHGSIVEFERFEPPQPKLPDEYVWRPLYSRGREIFVSDDSAHMHSTPDVQRRECLWRFM